MKLLYIKNRAIKRSDVVLFWGGEGREEQPIMFCPKKKISITGLQNAYIHYLYIKDIYELKYVGIFVWGEAFDHHLKHPHVLISTL